ncbi:sensor histidine kinase [Lewinella sp. 4G2]|uniref:sensor histidine kinase n=1 Tax=Lewinella sp. 4G2 TaxID=1803372 RepID=UPI0018D4D36E|nr:tetratricopeptide repeat protein [Lewinella sp. 4G2]
MLLALLPGTCVSAQSIAVDSLRSIFRTTANEEERFTAYESVVLLLVDERDTTASRQALDTLNGLTQGDDSRSGRYQYAEAYRAKSVQDWSVAFASAVASFDIHQSLGEGRLAARAGELAGLVASRMGKLEEAFKIQQRALVEAKRVNDDEYTLSLLSELGNTHRRLNNFDKAETYSLQSLELIRKLGMIENEVIILSTLGIIAKKQNRLDGANDYYEQALARADDLPVEKRDINKGNVYLNLAQLANSRNNREEAINYATKAIHAFEPDEYFRQRAFMNLQLGTAHLKLKRYNEAEKYYRNAVAGARGVSNIIAGGEKGLLFVFRETEQLDSTVHYLEKAAATREAAIEKNRIESIAEMEAKYQTKEQQAEIERLAYEDGINRDKLSRQRNLIIGGLLIMSVLSGFLYFIWQQRQRISRQHQIIEVALNEKETLLKEIHHRVKNNLQMISSLLSLQSRFIDDPAALSAMEMGRQRVRSMAIIHQRLYLRDSLSPEIGVKDYLEQLVTELLGVLNVKGLALKLEMHLEDIKLDIDRMIPLGLIANELITNSLKYAFTGREDGLLSINLQKVGDDIVLQIADDGSGYDPAATDTRNSFGSLLISTLSEQLAAELQIATTNGTTVTLRFPETE